MSWQLFLHPSVILGASHHQVFSNEAMRDWLFAFMKTEWHVQLLLVHFQCLWSVLLVSLLNLLMCRRWSMSHTQKALSMLYWWWQCLWVVLFHKLFPRCTLTSSSISHPVCLGGACLSSQVLVKTQSIIRHAEPDFEVWQGNAAHKEAVGRFMNLHRLLLIIAWLLWHGSCETYSGERDRWANSARLLDSTESILQWLSEVAVSSLLKGSELFT